MAYPPSPSEKLELQEAADELSVNYLLPPALPLRGAAHRLESSSRRQQPGRHHGPDARVLGATRVGRDLGFRDLADVRNGPGHEIGANVGPEE